MAADIKPNYTDEIKMILRGNVSPKVIHDKLEDYHASDIAGGAAVINHIAEPILALNIESDMLLCIENRYRPVKICSLSG